MGVQFSINLTITGGRGEEGGDGLHRSHEGAVQSHQAGRARAWRPRHRGRRLRESA